MMSFFHHPLSLVVVLLLGLLVARDSRFVHLTETLPGHLASHGSQLALFADFKVFHLRFLIFSLSMNFPLFFPCVASLIWYFFFLIILSNTRPFPFVGLYLPFALPVAFATRRT